VKSFKDCSINY